MSCQLGILDRPQDHATVLTFDVADAGSVQKSLAKLWEDLAERLHDWYRGQNLTVTIGFGLPIFDKLGQLDRMPKALKLMPGWEGDAFDPKATQADLIVQVCSDHRAVNFHVERAVRKNLSPAFALKSYHEGFGMPESRGVLGFVDGTGNPKGDARVPVVLIGVEDEPNRDGSYLALREIREDLDRWEQLSVDAQERVVGRRKADSAKFDPEESTPLDSHRLKSSVETEEGEIEILRRSFPFSGPSAAGLVFICFVHDLSQYEAVKGQMVSRYT